MPSATGAVPSTPLAQHNDTVADSSADTGQMVLHSDTARNLLTLSQDVAALLSLSLETSASYIHNFYRHTLGFVGIGEVAVDRPATCYAAGGQGARGLAVVVVGGGQATGRSLSLRLAKSGYTVFPLVPLPSTNSPPTSASLSSLLLAWSRMQKRLKAKYPEHPGTLVPVITDPDSDPLSPTSLSGAAPGLKARSRYSHAGETVRAYCIENSLVLVSVVCAARRPRSPSATDHESTRGDDHLDERSTQNPVDRSALPPTRQLSLGSLTMADEQSMVALYRSNILEPLGIVRELCDLLSHSQNIGRGRSRVIFVNGSTDPPGTRQDMDRVVRLIGFTREKMARLLREELAVVGVDVCEVIVGPMSCQGPSSDLRIRRESMDSTEGQTVEAHLNSSPDEDASSNEQILARRVALLSRIWAVDDALLFSAVRRAMEERYPRYRHHAGISPLIASIANVTPGSGLVKMIGRWIVGRLLAPRR